MAKDSRFKKTYRANASKLHKSVGNMLKSSKVFGSYKIYQEYPVNRVSPDFSSGRERYDWVILDLELAIECHGEQHYRPVRFGGITEEEAEANFRAQQERDRAKKQAAEEAGWKYIVFKYDEDISIHNLLNKIDTYRSTYQVRKIPTETPRYVQRKQSQYHQEQLRRAKKYRRQQYQRWKRRKNENKGR